MAHQAPPLDKDAARTPIEPPYPGMIEPPHPGALAVALRAQIENLATLNPDDPFYAQAAEQLRAIVAGLEERASMIEPPRPY
jgi:hypothetical protein